MKNDESSQAPEYRHCPFTGRVSIVAPARAARPMTLGGEGKPREADDGRTECPFCPGMEHDTPNEVYSIRDPGSACDGPGWQLRVVPNKFPAVRRDALHAFGCHELVIETERHVVDPSTLADAEVARILMAYRERRKALHAVPGVREVVIFKNVGAEAGASLAHTHSQIVALPFVTAPMRTKLQFGEAHFRKEGRNLWADELEKAGLAGRVVGTTAHFALVTAGAPRMSFEMLLMPRFNQADYGEADEDRLAECATLLKAGVTALDRAAHRPAYNWWLHSAPDADAGHFRWHLEILPRTARIAGFEWAANAFIVAVAPEAAAARLRAAMPGGGMA